MALKSFFAVIFIFIFPLYVTPRRRPDLSDLSEIGIFECNSTSNCYCEQCDDMCKFYNDNCCVGSRADSILEKWQYACVRTFPDMETVGLDCWRNTAGVQGVFMVTKCSKILADNVQLFNCEKEESTLLSRIPVYEKEREYMTYKNMYCALCNGVNITKLEFWKFEVQCNFSENADIVSSFDPEQCVVYLFHSNEYKICTTYMVDTCPAYYSNFSLYDVKDRCEKGKTGPLYDGYETYTAYKNVDCYLCNVYNLTEDDVMMIMFGVDLAGNIVCTRPNTCYTPIPSYSLKQLVNLNTDASKMMYLSDQFSEQNFISHRNKSCNTTEEKCLPGTCIFVRLSENEVKFNETVLYVKAMNAFFASDMFYINDTKIYVCLSRTQRQYLDQTRTKTSFQDFVERLSTFVGFIVSIVCLFSTFCVYLCFQRLRNDHGRIMMNLLLSLFCAQLSFIVSFSFQTIKPACITFGVLTHYFFLVAFCAMNTVGFDSFRTFSKPLYKGPHQVRVLLSIVYSWVLPLVVVLTAVIFDNARLPEILENYSPEYGKESCWINSSKGLLVFFFIPLAVFKLIDVVLFSGTCFVLVKAFREGSKLSKNQDKCSFLINLKLALIMGLTWLFSFLANFVDSSLLWYLFILFNSLQGLFIFVSLACTRNVCNIVRTKRHAQNTLRSQFSSNVTRTTRAE